MQLNFSIHINYTFFLVLGQYYGNCGWQTDTELPRNGEKTGVKKIFLPCKKELDKFCGLLQCTRANPTDLNTNIKNHALVKFSYPYRTGREDKQCLIASFDVGEYNGISHNPIH